jgi:hypothetical protein
MQTINTASTAEHRINLTTAFRVNPKTGMGAGQGKDRMFHEGGFIGESRQPTFDAARYLLTKGLALPSDRITTYRDRKACCLSTVGRAAKLTVAEDDKRGLRIAAWRPFVKEAVKPLAKAAE